MPAYYLYQQRYNTIFLKWARPIISMSGIFLLVLLFNYLLLEINLNMETYNDYSEYTDENVKDGLGSLLYQLPAGIKQVSIMFFSQLSPLPPWVGLNSLNNLFINITGIVLLVTTIYWSYVFLFTSISFFDGFLRFNYPFNFFILFFIVLLFLLFNTSNMNVRRLLSIYPIIIILHVFTKEIGSSSRVNYFNKLSFRGYFSLIMVYIFVKFII